MNKIKVGSKIYLGFGVVFILSILICLFGIFGVKKLKEGIFLLNHGIYAEVGAISQLQGNVRESVLKQRDYILNRTKMTYQATKDSVEKVLKDFEVINDHAVKLGHGDIQDVLSKARMEASNFIDLYEKSVNETVNMKKIQKDSVNEIKKASKLIKNFYESANEYVDKLIAEKADVEAITYTRNQVKLGITIYNDLDSLYLNLLQLAIYGADSDYGEKSLKLLAKIVPDLDLLVSRIRSQIQIEAMKNARKQMGECVEQIKEYVKADKRVADLYTQMNNSADNMLLAANQAAQFGTDKAYEVGSYHDAIAAKLMKYAIGSLILGLALALLMSIGITRGITKQLKMVIDGLTKGSEHVVAASAEVSSASQSLAEGSSSQASSLEETSSSLEEMASMTKQNADNSRQADNLMKEANHVIKKANDSMEELITSMEDITQASEDTSKIIKTIDEIAFQTNLLALNAAVEAARAGEAGAGFAVVADEVRNLAMRAADAARNTAGLIESTVKKIKDGSGLVNKTNAAFLEVAKSASKVGELVGEITAASQEQAQGIEQINKAVVEIDRVTQKNSANAEESASASEEMSAQAKQMKGIVNQLVVMVGGKTENGRYKTLGKNDAGKGKTYSFKREVNNIQRSLEPNEIIPMDDEGFKDF